MSLCGTKNVFSMTLLEEPSEAPLFLRVKRRKGEKEGKWERGEKMKKWIREEK